MYLNGSDYSDTITGTMFNDRIMGRAGHDILRGGIGADTINGGWGQDVLIGGIGSDVFEFTAAAHSTVRRPDTILDFVSGVDKIDLTSLNIGCDDVTVYHRRVDIDTNDDGKVDMCVQINTQVNINDFIF